MPIAEPEVGTAAKAIFTAAGGSAVTLKNSDWSLMRKTNNKEAPNTSDGMLRAPGLFDASGTIKGSVDSSQPIEGDVVEGTIGVLKIYRNATKFFQLTIIVDSLKIDTGVDQIEGWEMAWSLQSGTITNPTGDS